MSSRAFAFAVLSRVMRFDRDTNKILTSADNGISVESGSIEVSNGGIQVEAAIESSNRKVANTVLSGTTLQTIDTFVKTDYRSARYLIVASNGTDYHTTHIMLQHDGTNVQMVQFASIYDASELATFTADISSTLVRLRATPLNSGTTTFNYNLELLKS